MYIGPPNLAKGALRMSDLIAQKRKYAETPDRNDFRLPSSDYQPFQRNWDDAGEQRKSGCQPHDTQIGRAEVRHRGIGPDD